jgi:hypothetical protein
MPITRHVGTCRCYAAHNNQLKAGDGTYDNQLKAERKGGGGDDCVDCDDGDGEGDGDNQRRR